MVAMDNHRERAVKYFENCVRNFLIFFVSFVIKQKNQSYLSIYLQQYNDGGKHVIRVNGNQNIRLLDFPLIG